MHQRITTFLIVFCLLMSGCKSALLEMRDDNQKITERVSLKESELVGLKDQNQQFLYEKSKLVSELNQKNLTLDELSAQVDKLKAANSQIKADTDAERAKKAKLTKSLDEYSKKIKNLKRDDQLGIEEKKKKNEELQQQIKDRMIRDLESN